MNETEDLKNKKGETSSPEKIPKSLVFKLTVLQ